MRIFSITRLRHSTSIKAIIASLLLATSSINALAIGIEIQIKPPVMEMAPSVRPTPLPRSYDFPELGPVPRPTIVPSFKVPNGFYENGRLTDNDFIEMCGDPKSADTARAVVKIRRALQGFVSKISKDVNPEDVSHEAIRKMLDKCQKIISKEYESPVAVALTATRRLVYSEFKRSWVVYVRDEKGTEIVDKLHDKSPTPHDALEEQELIQKIGSVLSPREKDVMMGFIDDKSTMEIAVKLGITDRQVRNIRENIKSKIRLLSE